MVTIGVASLVFGEETARGGLVGEIEDALGHPAALAVEGLLRDSSQSGNGWAATVVGLAALLFGASGVFVELRDALNTIWRVTPKSGQGIWSVVCDRALSFALIVGTGCLLLISLAVSTALAAVTQRLSPAAASSIRFWQALNFLLSSATMFVLFAMIYKVLPGADIAWRDVWAGAALATLLLVLGKHLIGLYLAFGATTSAFGAAGSVILLLIWVYYSAQILLFGAEFARAYALERIASVKSVGRAEPP
jgi:membrane protein